MRGTTFVKKPSGMGVWGCGGWGIEEVSGAPLPYYQASAHC